MLTLQVGITTPIVVRQTMLRIKKLDIFIAKQFGLLFLGTFFICQFVNQISVAK